MHRGIKHFITEESTHPKTEYKFLAYIVLKKKNDHDKRNLSFQSC